MKHISFWVGVTLVLTLYFGHEDGQYGQAFFFSSFLLPIAIGISYFFNGYLVPTFLLTQRYFRFALYSFYALVIGVYLELLIAMFSFVVLANYQFDGMNALTVDLFALGLALFFIVLAQSFFSLAGQVLEQQRALEKMTSEEENAHITVTVDRKQVNVALENLLFVESLSDYVKLHTDDRALITRERISQLAEALPDHFLRIHRSFIINTTQVESFNKEHVMIKGTSIPISRSYKKEAWARLSGAE